MDIKFQQKENILTWFTWDERNIRRPFELQLFKDSIGYWLNSIYLDEELRPNGRAAKLFNEIQNQYPNILISIADKGAHKRKDLANDCRYIEPPDGERFVANLFKYKIVPLVNFRNPFPDEPVLWAKTRFPFLFQNK